MNPHLYLPLECRNVIDIAHNQHNNLVLQWKTQMGIRNEHGITTNEMLLFPIHYN